VQKHMTCSGTIQEEEHMDSTDFIREGRGDWMCEKTERKQNDAVTTLGLAQHMLKRDEGKGGRSACMSD
jgi:hypothetical protein